MKKDNIVLEKSKAFSSRIIKLYNWLCEEKHEFILSKQVLRSGTSIGANLSESLGCQSTADFITKLHISLKEARETNYWIDLLHDNEYIDDKSFNSIHADIDELLKLLTSILRTTKANDALNS